VDDNAERIVVPNDPDLRGRIMYEYHDVPTAGHPGREKTYSLLTRDFYWNHQCKWVRKYVRTCDVCQRVKPAPHSQAPLQLLPTPSECWESISMDFVFGLPRDSRRKTGIVVFVDRFSKMVHLAAVAAEVTSVQTARLLRRTTSRRNLLRPETTCLCGAQTPRRLTHRLGLKRTHPKCQ
ncbi:reverse transcriptase, partial [Phytophthora megakarya]